MSKFVCYFSSPVDAPISTAPCGYAHVASFTHIFRTLVLAIVLTVLGHFKMFDDDDDDNCVRPIHKRQSTANGALWKANEPTDRERVPAAYTVYVLWNKSGIKNASLWQWKLSAVLFTGERSITAGGARLGVLLHDWVKICKSVHFYTAPESQNRQKGAELSSSLSKKISFQRECIQREVLL